jgi:hypothetical protein
MAIFRGVGSVGDVADNSLLEEITAQAEAAEASATAAANSATSALNTELTSASFSTSDGVLTLTKQDNETVTTDLDGRFHIIGTDIPNADISEASVTQHQSALSITESQINDLQSYITDYTVTQSDVTAHQAALSITESQISNLQSYLTSFDITEQTDPKYLRSDANDTTTGTITAAGLIVDTDTLYVDATNNRVGIGTTSPIAPLQVNGTIYAEGGTFDAPDDGNDPSGSDNIDNVAFVMPRNNKLGFWHDGYFRSLLHQDPQGVTQIGQINTNYITAIKLNCGTSGDVTIQNTDGDAGLTVQGALTASSLAYPTADGTNGQVIVTDGNGTLSFTDQSGGIALSDLSVSGTEGTASGDGGIAYNNSTGVFTYTPPDLSSYLTSFDITTQTDPKYLRSDGNDTTTGTITAVGLNTSGQIISQRTDNNAGLVLKSSDTDAQSGPVANFIRNNAEAGATGDALGHIRFMGQDSDSDSQRYASITAHIEDPTDASHDGGLDIAVAYNAQMKNRISIKHVSDQSSVVINEAGDDVDFRVESDTNQNALFLRGSDGNVGIGKNDPSTALDVNGTITATGLVSSSITYPTSDGSSGQALITDGSGNLSFSSIGGAWTSHSSGETTYSDQVGMGSFFHLDEAFVEITDDSTDGSTLIPQFAIRTNTTTSKPVFFTVNDDSDLQIKTNENDGEIVFVSGSNERLRIHEDGNIGVGIANPQYKLDVNTGSFRAGGLIYPTSDGTNGQVLVTNGSGTLSFADQSGGGSGLSDIVEDTTPQLGGNLDCQNKEIQNTGKISGGSGAELSYYVFNNDVDTGISNLDLNSATGNDCISLITGGTHAMFVNASQQVGFAAGTHAAPSITFKDDTDTGISNSTANTLDFSVGGNDKMRLDSSGKLLIGTTSTGSYFATVRANGRIEGTGFVGNSNSSLFTQGGNMGGATIEVRSYTSYSSSAQNLVSFQGSTGSVRGSITMAGISTQYNTTSDERMKENIQDAGDAGAKIDAIRIRQFDWKEGGVHQDFGVIAQELNQVAPEAVAQGFAEEDMWSVDYSKLVPTLIKEIQSLRARVAELESE